MLRRRLQPHVWHRVAAVVVRLALIYPVALLALCLTHSIAPHRGGLVALSQVVAPYLFVPLVLLAPLAFLGEARVLRWALGLCLLAFLLRFSPSPLARLRRWAATPEEHGSPRITVVNWNAQNWGPADQEFRLRRVLMAEQAGIVVLEVTYWEWLRRDPAIRKRYPYQLNHTSQASSGLVLLSSYPILRNGVPEQPREVRGWPRLIWAKLDLGGGRQLTVVAAHPESPYSSMGNCRFPRCYNTAERDSLVPRIREYIEPALSRGEHVLVVGDMNMTDREPVYHDLARGLRDTHRYIGPIVGLTWGLVPELAWSWPLLRIDYLLSSPNLVPIGLDVDCAPRGSDHCLLRGNFELR